MTPNQPARQWSIEWTDRVEAFVAESNRIEGITRPVTKGEREAHKQLWALDYIDVPALECFVADVAARPLRRAVGQDVIVGNHRPPRGGPSIEGHLGDLLSAVNGSRISPYEAHRRYELLHPFIDSNGRSGRALWAWQMLRDDIDPFGLGFLHRWYYQSLDEARS